MALEADPHKLVCARAGPAGGTLSGIAACYGRARRMKITIHRRVPSQNVSQYAHWRTYTRERDTWFILLRAQLPPRAPCNEPVRLVLHSFRVRLVDYANLVGGAKPIPDGLIRLGYLKDDSPRWFSCDYFQSKVPRGQERTVLEFIPWSGRADDAVDDLADGLTGDHARA